jgi:ADP-ribosylglycohydrolase
VTGFATIIAMPTDRRDRIAGALLGVHAGDSLGATVEFRSWASIRAEYPDGVREITGGGPFGWPPGHATDDTDLTRAVLLAYTPEPAADPVRAAADGMLAWISGDWPGRAPGSAPRDAGAATTAGLANYSLSGDPRKAGAGPGQAGNGSLMRCVPTALAVADPAERILQSREISAITHDDPRCTASCAAYNEIVAALVADPNPARAVDAGERTAASLGVQPVVDAMAFGRALDLQVMAATGVTYLPDEGAGYVLDSLSIAVSAVLDVRPFEDVLVDVVRLGRDTDTNGAIAGGLLGARDGAAAIPSRWVSLLQFRAEFAAAARMLA